MELKINDSRKVFEIQDEFNSYFPYLKIEFFSKPHKKGEGSAKSLIKNKDVTIKECRRTHNAGSLTITPKMTVNDLEQQFVELYGLPVQIFRKSGKTWLETTVTDSWTIEKQEAIGKEMDN